MSTLSELPRWCRRPRLAVALPLSVVVLAVTGGLFVAATLEPFCDSPLRLDFMRLEHWSVTLGLGISTSVLLAIALAIGTAHEDPVGGRPLIAYAALGMLNGPAAFAMAHALQGELPPARLELASLVGMCGIPLGLAFGAVFSPVTRRLRRVVTRPTLSDHGSLLQLTGSVAAAGGLLITALVTARRDLSIIPLLLPVGLVDFGLLSLAAGWALKARLRQLAEHCDRVPLSDLGIDRDALLPLESSGEGETALVLPLPERGPGSYRSAELRVPVALAD